MVSIGSLPPLLLARVRLADVKKGCRSTLFCLISLLRLQSASYLILRDTRPIFLKIPKYFVFLGKISLANIFVWFEPETPDDATVTELMIQLYVSFVFSKVSNYNFIEPGQAVRSEVSADFMEIAVSIFSVC